MLLKLLHCKGRIKPSRLHWLAGESVDCVLKAPTFLTIKLKSNSYFMHYTQNLCNWTCWKEYHLDTASIHTAHYSDEWRDNALDSNFSKIEFKCGNVYFKNNWNYFCKICYVCYVCCIAFIVFIALKFLLLSYLQWIMLQNTIKATQQIHIEYIGENHYFKGSATTRKLFFVKLLCLLHYFYSAHSIRIPVA